MARAEVVVAVRIRPLMSWRDALKLRLAGRDARLAIIGHVMARMRLEDDGARKESQ